MKITNSEDQFFQKLPSLSKDQRIELLERRKSSLLHEMKVVSERMNKFIKSGAVSEMVKEDSEDAEKYRGCPIIPGSETRRLLAKDPIVQRSVLQTFARFSHIKEIFGSSVLKELELLQKPPEPEKNATKAK